jgi:hypothetical protein
LVHIMSLKYPISGPEIAITSFPMEKPIAEKMGFRPNRSMYIQNAAKSMKERRTWLPKRPIP